MNKRKIYAGDSAVFVELVRPLIDEPKEIQLVLRGPSTLTLKGDADGVSCKFTLTAEQSAELIPGTYSKVIVMSSDTQRASVPMGFLEVMPDPVNAEFFDGRSEAERALADIEKALYTFHSSGGRVKSYTIGSRQMTFDDLSELLALRDRLKIKVLSEGGICRDPRTLHVRFV